MQHGYLGFIVKCKKRQCNGIVAVAICSLYFEIDSITSMLTDANNGGRYVLTSCPINIDSR